MKNFYESYFTLLGLLTDPANLLTFKLEEGEYLVREAPIGLRDCAIGPFFLRECVKTKKTARLRHWAPLGGPRYGAAQNVTEIIIGDALSAFWREMNPFPIC